MMIMMLVMKTMINILVCMHAHVLVFASNTVLCLEKLLVLRYGYLLMPVFDEHSYCQSLSSVCYNP